MNKKKVFHASDFRCCICGDTAVAFWPCIDIDIPQHPYCRRCLDKEKFKVFMTVRGDEI